MRLPWSSVLRREGSPRREPTEAVCRRARPSSGEGDVPRREGDAVGFGVEGSGLMVTEDRPLSVEALVTELTREAASFLVIVTTRQGSWWDEPCPSGNV